MSKNQDINSHLYCPHDFSANVEFRDDLPTLLGSNSSQPLNNLNESILKRLKLNGPSIDVFHTSSRTEKKRTIVDDAEVKFSSPYKRYIAVLPFAEQERLAESARIAEQNRKRKLCPDSVIEVCIKNKIFFVKFSIFEFFLFNAQNRFQMFPNLL